MPTGLDPAVGALAGTVDGAASRSSPRALLAALAVAGLAFGAVLVDGGYVMLDTFGGVLDLFVGWSFTGVGLYASWRRPSNLIGPLMIATGFLWFVGQLTNSTSAIVFTLGAIVGVMYHATTIHMLVAFPTGRLETTTARRTAVAAYLIFFAAALPTWLVADAQTTFDCPMCPDNVLMVVHDETLAEIAMAAHNLLAAGLVAWVMVWLIASWRRSHGWRRRALSPVLFAGAATCLLLGITLVALSFSVIALGGDVYTAAMAAFAIVPYAFLLGLVRGRVLGGGAVGHLAARLTQSGDSGQAQEALRGALGDPTLEWGVRTGEQYIGVEGRPIAFPGPGGFRASRLVEVDGAPVAAFTYDAMLVDDPPLVEAAGAAAAVAIEKHQLEVTLRAKLDELRDSRARIVEAGDDERRRIERDLHDGAQQRLVSLALQLRIARASLGSGTEAAQEVLDTAGHELEQALAELRELARGIHPAILTNRGLDAALATLAARTPFPVEVVAAPEERLPENVESAAYFVVSEALANAIKHARASSAKVSVTHANGDVTIEVTDDGVGGADLARGSGLRGLADRVSALDGRLDVDSPPGRGTSVWARIPCE
jgi:signal transduction histidine kinase